MKICVLNGSPKGADSTTVQYARYMEKKIPGHEFVCFHVAAEIKKIEKNHEYFASVMEAVRSSDAVIWTFPLYVLLVHAGLKRFIELVWERDATGAFKGKYTALIAGSIHFFDNTAINYMQAVCDDLEMPFAGFYSADMQDFLDEKKRANFLVFAGNFINAAQNRLPMPRVYAKVTEKKIDYVPGIVSVLDTRGQKVVILTDCLDTGKNIGKMVERFRALTQADVIDISEIKMLASCQGCIHCGFDNECVFRGKDDVEEIYGRLKKYDVIVFAGEIRDRYLSARWKMFMDRRFFKTHQPHYAGKQIGYIVSGPLGQNQNMLEIFRALAQLDFSNFCGVLTDEYNESPEIDQRMDALASGMIAYARQKYIAPSTFLGVGGFKIFRDDMWGRLRFPFRMDYAYYKKHKLYDFPQKDIKSRLQNAFMLLLIRFPKIKQSINQKMEEYMIMPYKKILENE